MKEVTDKTFQAEVLDAKAPVVVDFWAAWCGPCRMLTPIVEELAEEIKATVSVVKMNIDENPETPTKFGIRSIPTLMLFHKGAVQAVRTGIAPKNTLREWVEEHS